MLALDKPVAGDQEYTDAPVAVSCVEIPEHCITSAIVLTTGVSMFIFTLSLFIETGEKDMSSRAKSLPSIMVFLFTIEIEALVLFPEFHVV